MAIMTEGLPDYSEAFTTSEPPLANPTGIVHATKDQAKPLLKIIKRMLQPRHPKNNRFTKPRHSRKTKKDSSYY